MKFTINTKDLLKKLQEVGGIIKTPNQMPILDNILFELTPGKLQITSDNLEVRATTEMILESNADTFSTCIPYQLFVNTLKGFPNTPIDITFDDKNVTIQSVTGNVINGEYKIPISAADEFPKNKFEDAEEQVVFNSLDFVEAIKKASTYVDEKCHHAGMQYLLLWIGPENTKVVSGHGHLIHEITLPVTGTENKMLISKSACNYLSQSITTEQDLIISYNKNHVFFILEGRKISAIMGNTPWPDYKKQVFEKLTFDKIFHVDVDSFMPALNRINNLTDQHSFSVGFNFIGNNLEMTFKHVNQMCDAKENLLVEYDGEPIDIGLNGKDLASVLKYLAGPIKIEMLHSMQGVMITGENINCLSMPIRI